jgi:pyrroloquinoline quinone biosynthesis protein B
MAVQGMRVYASAGMISALSGNRLWSPLVASLELIDIEPYQPIHLAPGLIIKPIPVPHRDEVGTDTFAYQIEGETSKLLYLPDIDSWESWPEALEILDSVDVALVDATFFSREEIPGREPVSHPLVSDTLAKFSEIPTRLVLTHLNHTNPLLEVSSEERRLVESQGVEVAHRGQTFEL